ncbi:MAG: LemA domain-containing protein [Planctomycetes bacterium]|nr:LemA domain-containing protein [Planctomycetota bacterium]
MSIGFPVLGVRPQEIAPFCPWVGGLLALLCLWAALRANRHRRWVDDTPTSKTTGVFIGQVEVKGTAEVERPLVSHLAEQPCVYYSWSVEEHWSRTVVETYRDSDGKTKTRTRHESGWTTVANGGEQTAFYLKDDLGVVLIQPEGAKIEPATIFRQTCGRGDPLYYAKGPSRAVAHSDHRRQFTETAIPLHVPLYVMGQARERQDVIAPEIARDPKCPLFLISCRSEKQISRGLGIGYWVWAIFGLVLAVGGVVAGRAAAGWPWQEDIGPYLFAAAIYVLAWVLGWVWLVFNSLVGLRNRVHQAWSLIEVQLKRRHDLIPNLVAAVQGLRDHERLVQTEVAELRTQMQATPPGEAGPDYHACARLLLAVQEKYPPLRAQDSFLRLQKNLTDTEQRIALARGYFNDIATYYNTRLERVPDRFLRGLARLQPQPLMTADDFERAAVPLHLAP